MRNLANDALEKVHVHSMPRQEAWCTVHLMTHVRVDRDELCIGVVLEQDVQRAQVPLFLGCRERGLDYLGIRKL